MTRWICARCAVEYPDSDRPPDRCAICSDERECVEPPGQRWTTLAELERDGHHGSLHQVEPGLFGIDVKPTVGIGQRALLVRSSGGNLLWDPTGYLDDDLIAAVSGAGGVAAIAASHPHMFGVQVEWSHRFGGHFPGSAVLHAVGADGRGILLCGDTFLVTPDQDWVTFMRSFPNLIPLSAAVVEGVAERVLSLDFDRLYDNFGGRVGTGAAGRVRRSAERYIGWVRGDHDNLTTVR